MNELQKHDGGGTAPTSKDLEAQRRRVVTSEELLGAQGELVILHRRQEYRLRRTQHGKLILTK